MGIMCSNGLTAFTLTRLDDIQRRLDDNQQDMKQMYLLLLGKGGKG